MEAFIKTIEEGDSSKIVWAIEVLEKISSGGLPGGKSYEEYMTCQHVGNVSLQSINLLNRSAELAIVIGEASARGKGVGKVACQFILDHAFMSLGLNRVWTGTAAPNIAMQKTCEHIGMAEEGRFKQGMFLNGYFTDVIAYGITANEYFSKKGEE
jgi:RimJ/RimL family protein N-acetyltransferase